MSVGLSTSCLEADVTSFRALASTWGAYEAPERLAKPRGAGGLLWPVHYKLLFRIRGRIGLQSDDVDLHGYRLALALTQPVGDAFAAVWPETVVSESALTVCLSEVRKALGDAAQAPQYIETIHRLGYRFIGPLQEVDASGLPHALAVGQRPEGEMLVPPPVVARPPHVAGRPPGEVVGQATARARLQDWLAQARGYTA